MTSAGTVYNLGGCKPTVRDVGNSSYSNTKFVQHVSYAAKVCSKGRQARTRISYLKLDDEERLRISHADISRKLETITWISFVHHRNQFQTSAKFCL